MCREGEIPVRVPLCRLDAITVFGRVTISPAVLQRCAADSRTVVWMSRSGRFVGELRTGTSGSVHLRRAQHATLKDATATLEVARTFVAGKLQNARLLLLRQRRDSEPSKATVLSTAVEVLERQLQALPEMPSLDAVRGCEGTAAAAYFAAFPAAIRSFDPRFRFEQRTRRPPRDRVNALLSFLYALLTSECVAALEQTGLDPQVGYLHALRAGRPALALDLMEELRPVLADRLVLTLINRKQVLADDFEEFPGGTVSLTEDGRRTILNAWQERKQQETKHRALGRDLPLGLLPHVQAQLLARAIRGELNTYLPYLHR